MRTPKPSLVDVVLLLILVAGIVALAFGTSRLQAAGLIAVVLSLGVTVAVRPRGRSARSAASRKRAQTRARVGQTDRAGRTGGTDRTGVGPTASGARYRRAEGVDVTSRGG
jgi:hypothetical protein